MITTKQLFKIYNIRTWKKSKFQIFLSIIAIAIAVAILGSLKFIIALNNSYITANAKNINEGDINVQMQNAVINNQQLNVLTKLTKEGKIQYAITYKMKNNFTSHQITSEVEVKFIDSNYLHINKRVASYAENLGNHEVLINKAVADKFNLKRGDNIYLVLRGFHDKNNKFKVRDIIGNTDVFEEDVLGSIILKKSEINNKMKKEYLEANINIVINKNYDLKVIKSELEKSFNSGAKIVTSEEGIQPNKRILDTEKKVSNFIQMMVAMITGIGICFTTMLLTLKRKRDYVLLSIHGMKQDALRNIILYETFIICAIGSIIGISFSFIITTFMVKDILSKMDVFSIIKVSIFPAVSTIVFVIVEVMIFTKLTIAISRQIKSNSILRNQTQKLVLSEENYGMLAIEMLFLMALCFSIYIGSLKIAGMCTSIMILSIIGLYSLARGSIYLTIKVKNVKSKFILLALRNIKRQKRRFAFCITALLITLVFCGLIVSLGKNLIPSMMLKINNDSGYNLSVSTNFNEKNISYTEKVLSTDKYVKDYIKTIDTVGNFELIQGKNFNNFIEGKKFYEDIKRFIKDFFNKNKGINIKAIDINKNMLKYDTIQGRWFTRKDINKEYIVLGGSYYHFGINVNDKVDLNIQGKNYKFTVIGICKESNFRNGSDVYIDINTLKSNRFIDDSNSEIRYCIKDDNKNQKKLYLNLTRKLKNNLIMNNNDAINQLNKYINQLVCIYIYFCFIIIFSAICLIGNILMIINFERLKEFVILNIVGAKNRDIKKIAIIEGVVVGVISGVLGSLICELISYGVLTGGFSAKYTFNLKLNVIMIIATITLNIVASLMTIGSLKIEKHSELLRSD